jgi:hypothetical protein
MKIYLLEASFFLTPRRIKSLHASMASLNVSAADLVNLILQEVELNNDATPEDWQAKCLQARYARAEATGRRVDDLDGGQVWFTEMDLNLPASPPPQTETVGPADQIISQIEELFPNWRAYRDLVDCITCELHELRQRAEGKL